MASRAIYNARVFVKSFGCALNFADGEVIAGCLKAAGYELVDEAQQADVLIYNTCAVKSATEDRVISVLKSAPRGKKLIVTGCLPLIHFERLEREVAFDGIIGPAPGDEIVRVVEAVLSGERPVILRGDFKPPLTLPKIYASPVIRIIPIAYGCLGTCAYCCVRFARGSLRSYPVQEIVDAIKRGLAEGAVEFWLTAQDTACYGLDIGSDLPSLLEAIGKLEGSFFVRVGMMSPGAGLRILDRLIDAYGDARIFKFLHLPVQSGDDRVLELMGRSYTADEFREVVEAFRERFPMLTLATDFICGFPGESEEAFQRSLQLLREVKPDVINVSKFGPRPGTPASKMKQLPTRVIKERSRRMSSLAREIALERNKRWIGWTGEALVDEVGKRPNSWVSRNFAYKPIVIEDRRKLLGSVVRVLVGEARPTYLRATRWTILTHRPLEAG